MNQREIMLHGGFLTAGEAARRIGVNNATIYRMITGNKVETVKAGPLTYIKAETLAEHYREAPPIFARIMEGVGENGQVEEDTPEEEA